ncbi:MAG: hypothetical protein J5I28_02235 [Acidimicrobiales bacterium]|jgi:uncharacterized membrane protein|nr:hypothetical protein [Acidimicrobiales bacterium]HLV91262.1 hypothetical protein [Acidimicrobiia bacterium]
MRFQWTGVGVVFGAALGFLLGQLVFEGAWWALVIGAAVGVVVGAVADGRTTRQG